MRPLPLHAETRGRVVAFEGVPQPPLRTAGEKATTGVVTPTALAGGGAILADAYSE